MQLYTFSQSIGFSFVSLDNYQVVQSINSSAATNIKVGDKIILPTSERVLAKSAEQASSDYEIVCSNNKSESCFNIMVGISKQI